jgi:hypothetical protein
MRGLPATTRAAAGCSNESRTNPQNESNKQQQGRQEHDGKWCALTSWRCMMRSTGHTLFQDRWVEPGT